MFLLILGHSPKQSLLLSPNEMAIDRLRFVVVGTILWKRSYIKRFQGSSKIRGTNNIKKQCPIIVLVNRCFPRMPVNIRKYTNRVGLSDSRLPRKYIAIPTQSPNCRKFIQNFCSLSSLFKIFIEIE